MELQTDRLLLRTLSEQDWKAMQRLFEDFGKSPYSVYDRPLPTDDQGARELTRRFASTGLFFGVFPRETMEMAGYVGFHQDGDSYNVGYCFHSAQQGKGYAYESVKALLEYLAENRGAARFTAGTALDNRPSCRLLEKLGFACVSTEEVCFDGEFSFQGGNFLLESALGKTNI